MHCLRGAFHRDPGQLVRRNSRSSASCIDDCNVHSRLKAIVSSCGLVRQSTKKTTCARPVRDGGT